MDIVVKGRHCELSERFRKHAQDKLAKVEKLDPKGMRIDVEVSKEHNPRQADVSERVELTLRSRGPVVRAEAAAHDPYAALDLAWAKLEMRLRRARDRKRVSRGGKTPISLAAAATSGAADVDALAGPPPDARRGASRDEGRAAGAATLAGELDGQLDEQRDGARGEQPDGEPDGQTGLPAGYDAIDPMLIREKTHRAQPMTLDQALYEMELVGHDFYLFVDAAGGRPSVVYRRRGYSYGVIHLDVESE